MNKYEKIKLFIRGSWKETLIILVIIFTSLILASYYCPETISFTTAIILAPVITLINWLISSLLSLIIE